MLHWLKFNKRLFAAGKLPTNRVERFRNLLNKADELRRINQYSYFNDVDSSSSESLSNNLPGLMVNPL